MILPIFFSLVLNNIPRTSCFHEAITFSTTFPAGILFSHLLEYGKIL